MFADVGIGSLCTEVLMVKVMDVRSVAVDVLKRREIGGGCFD